MAARNPQCLQHEKTPNRSRDRSAPEEAKSEAFEAIEAGAKLPHEPFNSLVRNGTAGEKIQAVVAAIKPEAIYFAEYDGKRGCIAIVHLADGSADATFHPVMLPEDLAKAGLDELGKKWAWRRARRSAPPDAPA